MKVTLYECFKEIYKAALLDIKRRFEKEALTERELWKELRRYIEEFEGYYLTNYAYEFFCEESPITDEFLKLVKNQKGVEVKDFELFADFPQGVRIPVEVRLYGYSQYFNAKIDALRKDPFYLVLQDNLRC